MQSCVQIGALVGRVQLPQLGRRPSGWGNEAATHTLTQLDPNATGKVKKYVLRSSLQ